MRHYQFHVKNSRNNIEAQRLKVELAISATQFHQAFRRGGSKISVTNCKNSINGRS